MSNLVGLGNVGIGTMTPQCALDVNGNVNVSGTIVSANTNMMFRNRIINGDMRLDQTRLGSNVQSGNVAASVAGVTASLDRFQLSTGPASSILAAKQVTLSTADQLAIGNISTKAVAISPSAAPDPTLGLTTLVTFENSNASDTLGGVAGPIVTGTTQYVTGKIGSSAVYLANEANMAGSGTRASNALVYSYTQSGPVSCASWLYFTKFPTSSSYSAIPWSFGNSNGGAMSCALRYVSSTAGNLLVTYNGVNDSSSYSISLNTWYHVVGVYVPSGYVSFYLNGSYIGSFTGLPSSFGYNGSLYLGDYVAVGASNPFAGYLDDFRIYNRALSPQDVAAIYNYSNTIPMAVTSTLTTGLVAHVTFEGGSVQDLLGGMTNPVWTGTPAFTTGKIGSSALNLSANPIASTINTCVDYSVTIPSAFTCALWINPTSVGTANTPYIICFGGSTYALNIGLNPAGVYVDVWLSGSNGTNYQTGYGNSLTSVPANAWSHVTVTISATATSGGYNSLYINGVLASSTATTSGYITQANSGTAPTKVRMGGYIGGGTSYSGYIDDFRIYNRVLSPAEILALAQATNITATIPNPLAVPATMPTSGLVSYFPFEGSLTDSQGANTLSMTAGTAQYVGGRIGTQALYIANEANVSAVSKGANYAQIASYSSTVTTSVSTWFYLTAIPSNGNYSVIWESGLASTTTEYVELLVQGVGNSTPILWPWAVGGAPTYGTAISAGVWYHAVVVFVPSTSLSLYVNGVLISTATSSIGAGGTSVFRIGESTAYTRPFAGYIDDFRIYNTALTASQISTLFYAGQPNAYTLYQQPIEAQTISDFAWGTSNAQSASVSAWIKNNTPAAQQFALALNTNPGLTTWIPFENGSAADVMGFLSPPAVTGTLLLSTTTYKVGSSALNLTANNPQGSSGSATASVYYSLTVPPLMNNTFSFWFNPSSMTAGQMMFTLGAGLNSGSNTAFSLQFYIASSTSIQIDIYSGSSGYQFAVTVPTMTIGTWYHLAVAISAGSPSLAYFNGSLVGTGSTVSSTATYTCLNNIAVTTLRLGCQPSGLYAFQGYLDDVRIYNGALTAAQINQLCLNNVSSTTTSSYLIPRSLVYTTPSIPSATWQKVAFTVPGDTFGTYVTDTTSTTTLSLCLGAGANISTSNVAAASGNTSNVWNTGLYYSGSNIQAYAASSSNFLAVPYNSVYLTGLQLEKGVMVTPFEYRNYAIENTLSTVSMSAIGSLITSSSAITSLSTSNITASNLTSTTITGTNITTGNLKTTNQVFTISNGMGTTLIAPIANRTVYNYTGGDQTFTVPAGVTTIYAKMWGAGGAGGNQGGWNLPGSAGGAGGFSIGAIAVTPGQQLIVMVGGKGTQFMGSYSYGGGGPYRYNNGDVRYCGGGGGRSAIRYNNADLLTAGGGGGGGSTHTNGGWSGQLNNGGSCGGAGGGLKGQTPFVYPMDNPQSYLAGAGGSQFLNDFVDAPNTTVLSSQGGNRGVGGTGGQYYGGASGAPGEPHGGGGGGGYYGGGGGYNWGNSMTGGGGGSGYIGGCIIGQTFTGSYTVPPAVNDSDYVSGIAKAGPAGSSATGGGNLTPDPNYAGGNGLVVIYY